MPQNQCKLHGLEPNKLAKSKHELRLSGTTCTTAQHRICTRKNKFGKCRLWMEVGKHPPRLGAPPQSAETYSQDDRHSRTQTYCYASGDARKDAGAEVCRKRPAKQHGERTAGGARPGQPEKVPPDQAGYSASPQRAAPAPPARSEQVQAPRPHLASSRAPANKDAHYTRDFCPVA